MKIKYPVKHLLKTDNIKIKSLIKKLKEYNYEKINK